MRTTMLESGRWSNFEHVLGISRQFKACARKEQEASVKKWCGFFSEEANELEPEVGA